jgi:hypothetical protein
MLRYFLCADCFGRKILNKSNGVVAVDRLLFWWFCVWIWKSKYVSLYIIEIWVWLFGWWLVREQLCCAHLITWNVADSRWTWLCNFLLKKSSTLYFTLLLCFYFALLFYQFDARVFNFSASFYMHIPLNTNNWFLCYQI